MRQADPLAPLPAPRTLAGVIAMNDTPDTAVVLVRAPQSLTLTLPTSLAWGLGLLCAFGAVWLALAARDVAASLAAWARDVARRPVL